MKTENTSHKLKSLNNHHQGWKKPFLQFNFIVLIFRQIFLLCLPRCEYWTMFWWAAVGAAANREKNLLDSSNSRSIPLVVSSVTFSLLLSSTRTADPLADRPNGRKPRVAARFCCGQPGRPTQPHFKLSKFYRNSQLWAGDSQQ